MPEEGVPMARVGSDLGLNNTPLKKDVKTGDQGRKTVTQGTGLTGLRRRERGLDLVVQQSRN